MNRILNKMSLGQKFSVVIIMMLIPMALLIFLLVSESRKGIDFGEKEITGVEYNAAVRLLIQAAANHRGLSSAYLTGSAAVIGKIKAAADDVDMAFVAMEKEQAKHGEVLGTTRRYQSLREEWKNLRSDNLKMTAAENFHAHNAFVENAVALITHVGDSSNLILDPDLDSFYLMNVVTVLAPSMLDEMGRLRGMGVGVINRARLSSEEQKQILILTVSINKEMTDISHSLEAAYEKSEDPELKAKIDEIYKVFDPSAVKFLETAQKQIIDSEGNAIISSQQYFDQATQAINAGYKLYDEVVPQLTKLLQTRVSGLSDSLKVDLLISAVFIAISLFMAWTVTRGVTGSMKNIIGIFGKISEGRLDTEIQVVSQDETGQVMDALRSMQATLKKNIDADRKRSGETARLKQALDVATANIMVADTNNDIIYVNNSALTMFMNAEKDIARDLAGFNASKLIGINIDKFHKNPSHQRNLLSALRSTHNAGFVVGGRTMKFIANPVFGDSGQRLGTVVEWQDRTIEVGIEKEVASIIEAAKSGDFSKRIDESAKQGFYLQMATGINEMIGVVAESLGDVAEVMSGLSQGDLTHTIMRDYSGRFGEVKDSVNATIERLSETIGKIRDASEFIRTSSEEISTGNNNLSQRAEQQASTLEETASSMEELTSTVKNNAENAQQANQLSGSARNLAEKGGNVVKEAVDAMGAITRSSHQIAEIIGVIDEIAFQTNLLALNASVEAARAGDQGRGFAVVASEVRNLAQRSASAAKEIKELIRDSESKVLIGNKLVNESGITLKEIVDAVKKVGDIVAEISAASQEQASGIEEVNRAITQMDEITQQNAALAEEASASSESSLQKAAEMVELVQFFRTNS